MKNILIVILFLGIGFAAGYYYRGQRIEDGYAEYFAKELEYLQEENESRNEKRIELAVPPLPKTTPRKIERHLYNELTKYTEQSIEGYNLRLSEWLVHDFATTYYDFPLLKDSTELTVVSSEDDSLRVFSWWNFEEDSPLYRNVTHYKASDGGVVTAPCEPFWWHMAMVDGDGIVKMKDSDCIVKIIDLQTVDGSKYYLVVSWSVDSIDSHNLTVVAYRFDEGYPQIVQEFFVSKGSSLESIVSKYYNVFKFHLIGPKMEKSDLKVFYDKKTKLLYMPANNENEFISGRYDVYFFTGSKMTWLKEVGDPHIHPSLQDFEMCLYRVKAGPYMFRVDLMPDKTLRYASWSTTAHPEGLLDMSAVPDLVLTGTGDGTDGKFSFINKTYTYEVDTRAGTVTVYHNGTQVDKFVEDDTF